jgi:hypothetical protein
MTCCHVEAGKTYLILSFEYQDIGNTSEGDAQMDDLCYGHLIRDVANVDHLRRFSVLILVQLHLQQAKKRWFKLSAQPLQFHLLAFETL